MTSNGKCQIIVESLVSLFFAHSALNNIKSAKEKAMNIEMNRIRIMASLVILAALMIVAASTTRFCGGLWCELRHFLIPKRFLTKARWI